VRVSGRPSERSTGPGKNDRGLSRKHILEAIHGSLRRLRTDHVDLYQAHRYDFETPLEETMTAFADLVRAGKALYVGVSEWTADQIERAAALARELRVPLVSNQPQYSMLWRVIEAEVVPASVKAGMGQLVWSPIAQGVSAASTCPASRWSGIPARPRALRGGPEAKSAVAARDRACSGAP
jgi:aryl-alcohol dehydrogenase-like predicted oxidoreductase